LTEEGKKGIIIEKRNKDGGEPKKWKNYMRF
jgi:hypothetical protein